jgi:hypothetical protein
MATPAASGVRAYGPVDPLGRERGGAAGHRGTDRGVVTRRVGFVAGRGG